MLPQSDPGTPSFLSSLDPGTASYHMELHLTPQSEADELPPYLPGAAELPTSQP